MGVDGVGHGGGGGVGDAPQGGQHVPVAGQLQGPSQVQRLIEQPQVAGGGLAGRQVGQVGLAAGRGRPESARVSGWSCSRKALSEASAGCWTPWQDRCSHGVAGQRVQDGLPGGGGAEQLGGVLGRGQVAGQDLEFVGDGGQRAGAGDIAGGLGHPDG